MDKVGILIVSKCLSSPAMVAAFMRSQGYEPEFYVAEKQANPFSVAHAKVHQVIPDLGLDQIVRFARRHAERIAFGLADSEDFVTAGGRDRLEAEAGVQMICVNSKFAVERSKADQRVLFDELCPEANPRYRVFDPKAYPDSAAAVADLKTAVAELGEPVIKPDAPARGAGVGVWGADFEDEDQMVSFFLNVYSKGRVVVEEKVDGEESSFQAFSDGRHFVAAPLTRDYKRALDGNRGRLTGGMGSYRGPGNHLPFLRPSDWEHAVRVERKAFDRWKGRGSNPGLRGTVLYDALMHTGSGFKILERNSRGGNTEQVNLLATMKDDFVEVCFRMLEGRLRSIEFQREASVVTCVVPEAYGTAASSEMARREITFDRGHALEEESDGRLSIFPMDVRLEEGKSWTGTSRSVAVVGTGRSLDAARLLSQHGANSFAGGVRHRSDIASASDVRRAAEHLKRLRRRQ